MEIPFCNAFYDHETASLRAPYSQATPSAIKFCQILVPLVLAKWKILKTLASLAPPPHSVGGTVFRNIPFATASPGGDRGTAFRTRVQRYDEHLPFSKFFGKKMKKKCIFVVLGQENDDFLERMRSSICFAVLEWNSRK